VGRKHGMKERKKEERKKGGGRKGGREDVHGWMNL